MVLLIERGQAARVTSPPYLRYDPSRLERRCCPTKVPPLLGYMNRRTHLLALKSPEKVPHDALGSAKLEKDGRSDFRTRFYNKFKEEVAEHDEDLQKMHDEDLNTTLIFVSFFPLVELKHPTCWGVRSVFSRNGGVHLRHPIGTQARLPTTEQRAPRASPQCHRWKYPSWTGSFSTKMVRPRSCRSSGPSHTLCNPLRYIIGSFSGYTRETVAQPIQADGNPWIPC